MIDLRITSKYPNELVWQAQLRDWCAAHKVIQDETLSEPELHQGDKVIKGVASIEIFLKDYKDFIDDWNDCRCDRWMDETS